MLLIRLALMHHMANAGKVMQWQRLNKQGNCHNETMNLHVLQLIRAAQLSAHLNLHMVLHIVIVAQHIPE